MTTIRIDPVPLGGHGVREITVSQADDGGCVLTTEDDSAVAIVHMNSDDRRSLIAALEACDA